MPEKIMDFVRLYMERKIEISALRRKEDYDIPLTAIREGILNAICHIFEIGTDNSWMAKIVIKDERLG